MADDLYYGDPALSQRIFIATAIVTAPVIFSTAAGTGGPLLWNNNANVTTRLIAVSFATTTASAAAGALGLTGGSGQTAAPTSTTAIDSLTCTNMSPSAQPPLTKAYRIGTVASPGAWFYPIGQVGTTALTALPNQPNWVDLKRAFVIHKGEWISIAASATLTTGVFQIGLMFEELPNPAVV